MMLGRRIMPTSLGPMGTERIGAEATPFRTPLRKTSSLASEVATAGARVKALLVVAAAMASGFRAEPDAEAERRSAALSSEAYARNSSAITLRSSACLAGMRDCEPWAPCESSSACRRER
eukprot:scaffold21249_cov32-Tisochrysis_lutea.AAC.1